MGQGGDLGRHLKNGVTRLGGPGETDQWVERD